MDLMSTAQLLGNFGEFVGAIAVVVTLAYLAVQVRQSRETFGANTRALDEAQKQARVNALRELAFNWNGIIRDAMGSRDAAAIFLRGNRDIEELDEIEQQIFVAQLVPFFNQSLVVLQMAQEGLLGEEIIGDDISEALDVLIGDLLRNNPGARACWQTIAHVYVHRDHVNKLLKREGDSSRFTFGNPLAAHTNA
ncbi:MAG: hypothetical protein AMJ65_18070 [Phycisphaerae bacterium SG8_4]|nr:MAG: hypothetical protein AMJ65_18070 [Phycisphaerae bacterium SG8_4]